MKINEILTEAVKQRLDPECWKGKHKEGTKIKGGIRVNNCVPNEGVVKEEARIETIHGSAYTVDPDKYYVWAWDNAVVLYGEYTDANHAELSLSKIERRATKRLGSAVKGRFEVASGKMLLSQYGGEQDVAEGLSQNQGQVRQTLNAWMNQDQSMNADPTQRASFQAKVWPFIQKNIQSILSDKGADGKGSYPAAPYAAWLLVQHMDAYPQNQGKFLQQLTQSGLNPTDGKDGVGKLQFLKDRYEVNKWILQNANNKEYFINNKPLPNPTVNVRNPAWFKDAGIIWTSRKQALEKAIEAGNKLLVAAVQETDAQTQPSYKSNVAEELGEEFDLIENIIENLAKNNGVDAETIWEDLESLSDDELYVFATTTTITESEAWQKANNKDKTDGMSQKAVNSYRREHPGSKLKTAVTTKPSKLKKGSKASKRRKSYCSRSRGQMKMHSISCAKTPDKAICKARRRWNC